MNQIKIMVADDHQLVREGIVALLETQLDFTIVHQAQNGKDVLSALRSGVHPDVILMDFEMPVMSGIEALEIIKKDFFGIKVIMLTMMNSKEIIQDAIHKQADGFLFKTTSLDELTMAIHMVVNGQKYFTGEVTMTLMRNATSPQQAALSKLSDREIEILKLVAKGMSSSAIGQQLFISPRTVDTHRNNILQKLEVHGIAGLTEIAIKNKLI